MTQTLGQCPKCGPLLNLKAGPGRWLLSHFMGEESDTQSYPGPSRKFMSELGFEPRTPNSSDVCLPLSSAVTQTQKAPRGLLSFPSCASPSAMGQACRDTEGEEGWQTSSVHLCWGRKSQRHSRR